MTTGHPAEEAKSLTHVIGTYGPDYSEAVDASVFLRGSLVRSEDCIAPNILALVMFFCVGGRPRLPTKRHLLAPTVGYKGEARPCSGTQRVHSTCLSERKIVRLPHRPVTRKGPMHLRFKPSRFHSRSTRVVLTVATTWHVFVLCSNTVRCGHLFRLRRRPGSLDFWAYACGWLVSQRPFHRGAARGECPAMPRYTVPKQMW